MKVRTLGWWAALFLACACSAKRLPPGTPPPEYEQRPVVPWNENPAPPAPEPEPAPVEPAPAARDAGATPAAAPVPGPDAGPGVFPERSGE